jgi:hypothetical protein
MKNKAFNALYAVLLFILAFGTFGILAGAFAGAAVMALAGKTAGLIVCHVVGGYVAFRCTRALLQIV